MLQVLQIAERSRNRAAELIVVQIEVNQICERPQVSRNRTREVISLHKNMS